MRGRTPPLAPSVQGIGGSVFSALARRLATFEGEVYPLHVGDTWLEPAEGSRMEDLRSIDHPGMHRYAPPQGRPSFLAALARRVESRTGVPTRPEHVLVTTGATGALGAAVGAIASPGDEVLLLAPYWPLIAGIVRSFHATPVAVDILGLEGPAAILDAIEAQRTERTVALYLGTPNNPTGRLLGAELLAAIAARARRHDLWLLADEVYEDLVYRGEHTPLRRLAPERTIAAHSFSKAYGMAGNRCGYAVGPAGAMKGLRKISIHTFYSTPTAAQIAAERVLGPTGDAWLDEARTAYQRLGEEAARRLGVPAPAGSTFLFPDVADRLDDSGLAGFLERCADRGLFLAPGPSFGPYPTHVRVCFTSAPPDVVGRGVAVLADLLGR